MKKSHCKAFLVLLSATLSMLFSTGCTAVQVRDRTYLQALELHTAENIEESDAAYRVGVHDFREAETGAAAVCSGETLTEALTQAAVETGGELFLGHLELLAYENGADAANFSQWMKTYQLSASCFILGLPDGDNLTEIDTSRLAEQLRYAAENAVLPETNLQSVLKELAGSAGTALIPVYRDGSIAMAVITEYQYCAILSAEAVQGLCWLRGDSYPAAIALTDGESFSVLSSSTQLTAKTESDHAVVTITIYLKGNGNFESARAQIEQQCNAAIQETVRSLSADVFDLEACLQSQCYAYLMKTGWKQAAEDVTFDIRVEEK